MYKLFQQRSDGLRSTFFSQRVVTMWNAMPPDVVDFTTVKSFKRTIKSIDFSVFLKATM